MKNLHVFLAAAVLLAAPAFAQVPVGPGSIKLGKVQPSLVSTPEYQITGGQNKRYETKKWIEIEISYDTIPEEINELTFKFTILSEKKLLEGEVTYVNIAKGKDHFAVVYVSPKSIDKLTAGKPPTAATIENVWVEVNVSGQVLAREEYRKMTIPNLPRVPGMVLNKNQTPFAPLFYDRYEEIKPR